ncbi:iron transporter [Myceligenerans salitolerans]|uniref:Iron transporter n=1 Tax=Myceligenerans salitolerans TaxID=1230528 RepID=A0ABS3IBF0_9MICO|nr:iron transporter [Myceligenerans salitolerans]MBO0610327.1 iron transporter [Myceligenerans salitolerans]
MTSTRGTLPGDPGSSEATERQLELAAAQGDAYRQALDHMAQDVAKAGGTQQVGDYLIGYAIEDAEGMYHLENGKLQWRNPGSANAHVEVVVCDAADGRFIPGLSVSAALVTPDGQELGPFPQELVWHPMLYHYARNWELPQDGEYTLRVHVDPPAFMRHDEINGRRLAEPADAEFDKVTIERGSEPVDPPV